MKNKKYRLIDLFAGCGGMSLGFQNAGFEIVAAYDFWQAAVDIYKANFQHPIHQVDLSKQNINQELAMANPDIIIGGAAMSRFFHCRKTGIRRKASQSYFDI